METIDYLRALGRSWFVVLLTSIAGGAGGLLIYSQSTPQYESSVRLVVASDTSGGLDEVTAQSVAVNRALSLSQIAPTLPAIQDAAVAAGHPGMVPVVSADAPPNQPFVVIKVDSDNATSAQQIANAYVSTLPKTAARLAVGSKEPVKVAGLGPATFPTEPFAPKLRNDVGFSVAVGFALGIALILLRELFNQAVQTTDELRALVGARVLGTIPRDLPRVALPVATAPQSLRAEAYRQLRTALLTRTDSPARAIAITSAAAREGKTTIAANLAISLGRAGHRVVLVDADLRRPQVAEIFGISRQPGLTDVLLGKCTRAEALIAVEALGVVVICAGSPHGAPSELLGSAGFDALVAALVADYAFVIVDTPPMLPVTDALVIAPRLDGVVVVTRLARTTRAEVRDARTSVEATSANVIGYVGNQARRSSGRQYRYGYKTYAADDSLEVIPFERLSRHVPPDPTEPEPTEPNGYAESATPGRYELEPDAPDSSRTVGAGTSTGALPSVSRLPRPTRPRPLRESKLDDGSAIDRTVEDPSTLTGPIVLDRSTGRHPIPQDG